MKIKIIKTFAKTVGLGLYKAGEIYTPDQVENLNLMLESGFVEKHVEPVNVKQSKGSITTKEEKRTRRRRTKKA